MSIQTDVKSGRVTASGSVFDQRTRVKGLLVVGGGTAGTVVLNDGGAGGTAKLTIDVPANAPLTSVLIPGEGILFETNVYVTLTNATSATVFYG